MITTIEGNIIHSKGNTELSKEQNKSISEIMTRVWNSLSEEKRLEITNEKGA